MKIAAIVVTWNRVQLLTRALDSIRNQTRLPEITIVVSNSSRENQKLERLICKDYGYHYLLNSRTGNTSGAINSGIEAIVKMEEIAANIYIALLDDDDEWLPLYLETIESQNHENYDIIAAELSRNNGQLDNHQVLPNELNIEHFLEGNPGIGNSNSFIKLPFLLMAGCYDEACLSNIDRDLYIRLFQLKPTYHLIHERLIVAHTDNDRPRITNNIEIRKNSFSYLYYKYSALMSEKNKINMFNWVKLLFNVERNAIEQLENCHDELNQNEIVFNVNEKNCPFIIGFVTDNDEVASNLVSSICKKIPLDHLVVINNSQNANELSKTIETLSDCGYKFEIVNSSVWGYNMKIGMYGDYFKKFDKINSIPLGRTILHHHLYEVSQFYENPTIWIIDDDVEFTNISNTKSEFNFFQLIKELHGHADVVIGGISCDPPIPTLSCLRTQLVDFLYNSQGPLPKCAEFLITDQPDYYYDLTDLSSDHLEKPVPSYLTQREHLHNIFAGKSVTRPAIQNHGNTIYKTVTKRGGNTIIFDREVLRNYPVINLEFNTRIARRGDLTWAILNQLVANKMIVEHGFCLNHKRVYSDFDVTKELEKSAYDIVGFAFNKAIARALQEIAHDQGVAGQFAFSQLLDSKYFNTLQHVYTEQINHRLSRFLMNYYRIIGLTMIISEMQPEAESYCNQLKNTEHLKVMKNRIPFELVISMVEDLIQELQHRIEGNPSFR